MLRKSLAQVGVLLFIASMLESVFFPLIIYLPGWLSMLAILLPSLGVFALVVASVLPADVKDEWGSMWPLVGYDNAIDAVYTRGPWWVRFAELEEQERTRRVVDGMNGMFGGP
jgi:hypothetical protein